MCVCARAHPPHTHMFMKKKPMGAIRHHSMEPRVVENKGFPEHEFIKVIKHAWSPHSKIVRHFNTLSDVSVVKNHLGVLAEMYIPFLPPTSHPQEILIQQIWAGIQGSESLTSTPGFAHPKSPLVAL